MNTWINIKDKLPPCRLDNTHEYVLAYHTLYGVGVAWFWILEDIREELEEDFNDKYFCSCQFIKNKPDGNYCIDDDSDIDIFERVHFSNLGVVTHWMPLPKMPENEDCKAALHEK
jgi:Protein of unknown function (DUF551)